jgi:hypothetical protein
MKKVAILALAVNLLSGLTAYAQKDKSQRLSPPVQITETTSNGVTIHVDYSQPSLKGRIMGRDIVPFGQVWRTGANEATVFEINKDVVIDGKNLPAGKYGLYTIPGETLWTVIFSKSWNQSGTRYDQAEDALRMEVRPHTLATFMEKMTFDVKKDGEVSLMWGNTGVAFNVK